MQTQATQRKATGAKQLNGMKGMEMTMRDLKLHTLRGDILSCAMDGLNERGIRNLLEERYVNLNTDITIDEFNAILSQEYAKAEARRNRQSKAIKR